MQTISVEELHLTPPGQHLPPPINKGQQRVYVQSGGYIFELELTSQRPVNDPHTSQRILFGAIQDPRLKARRPILVDIANVDGTFTASAPDLEEFGYGNTRSQALDDFGRTLSELYFSLSEQREHLGEHLRTIQAKLHEYLELRLNR